ncbi:MAG: hypothetical protein JWM65_2730 [Sphingomonas bacterium]|nr:hypothetical protein [Sphingomonas bacterium]
MSMRIATLFLLLATTAGSAQATSDPTNDPTRDREIYRVMLDRYARNFPVCVVQKPDDYPRDMRWAGTRGLLHANADWRAVGASESELREINRDFASLVDALRQPIVGHYISPDLLSANMRLVDDGNFCSPKLKLSAPAFRGETAFIDSSYNCALCGLGATFALRRRDGHWQIAAEWVHWVS